jgi:hypothetical protein
MTMFGKKMSIVSCRAVMGTFTIAISMLGGAGCGSSELETGYKPRPLSSSDAQRRAFYAPQYSREAAMAAQQQQQQGGDAAGMSRHRPGAPY